MTLERKQEAYTILNPLSEGGQVTIPIHNSFFGKLFWNVNR